MGDDDADSASAATAPPGRPAWLGDPAALLPLAVVAIVIFGGLHLIADIVAFSGDFMGQLGGILTDFHTIVTGVALIVGLTAAARRPPPVAVSSWRVLSWVARVRTQPAPAMRLVVMVLLAVGALQTVVAFWNRLDGDDLMSALRLLTHDLAYLVTVAGIVVTLAAVAVARSGVADWSDATSARDLVTLALYAGPALALLAALLTLIELIGDQTRSALAIAAFLTIEAAAALAILLVANVAVRSRVPVGDGAAERIPLRGVAASAVGDPARFIRPLVGVVIGVGILYVLLLTADYGQISTRLGFAGFADSLFDVVALVTIMIVARADATEQGALGLVADELGAPSDPNLDRALAWGMYAVAYLGVFSALVSAWVFRGDGWEVWYWFFNRLVRTAIVLGVLLGLQTLRADRTTTAATRPSASGKPPT